ncbi:SPOR domain-containing protein [Oleiagrimonas soli]|uniref:Cell division protein FtsN n=1 Tax=Oleiagrimonas soli TaxID=1543381 RepID=A0A099D1N3_9GAMM|nr:SPOR domain-containing protein [Oleiagrimonas soli]KGI79225.1 sporulation protein [Oleiagrimonas soli]MBB6184888.1 cell division protein FtsN [Oleiagrimonas soli]
MAARKSKQAVRNGGFPAWGWVLIGLIVGAILMAMATRGGWLPMGRKHDGPQPNPNATVPRDSEPGVADQTGVKKKAKYDFYSVLPEKEVIIPDAEISRQAKAEAQPGTPAPADSGGYLLQVGSFPNAADAESMKAKLALQGFVADVKPVTIDGQTWNRVRLGPYASAAKLEAAKQRLASAGIKAIALKEH